MPTGGTSDVYSSKLEIHECPLYMPYFGTFSHIGTQRPRTGSRFAGIILYAKGTSPDTTSYREYLQIKLTEALKQGEKYCAEMYVSLAEASFYENNNLGIRFNTTETSKPYPFFSYLGFVPQIVEKKIISDTSNWVRISGFFEATDPFQYLVIGNFSGDGSTEATRTNSINTPYHQSYYFIDDVNVEQLPHDKFKFSGVTTVCSGDSALLTASAGTDYVEWTTLRDSVSILNVGVDFVAKPTETTTYRVKSKGCGKTVIDTISVKVNPRPQIELGRDTAMCENHNLLLKVASGYQSYQWQDHTTENYFEVEKPGTYSVNVTNGFNCSTYDQIKVSYDSIPRVDLGQDQVVCEKFPTLIAGDDRNLYHWSDGSIYHSLTPRKAGTYWVSANNHCGMSSDTIRFYTPSQVFIPNVVTANGDQINDQFMVGVITPQETVDKNARVDVSLKVFDRWGQAVFQERNYAGGWPALNSSVNEGIYYYLANVEGCKEYKGWVQVIK